jgi:uncharacterized protein (DUF952 family)
VEHRTAAASRDAKIAYHLVPVPVWDERGDSPEYVPEAYEADGFIHTTNGIDPLLAVANLFYTGDPRPYMVLVLDTTRLASELRYDDDEKIYPHIYGPLNTDAVIGSLTVERGPDGAFLEIRQA